MTCWIRTFTIALTVLLAGCSHQGYTDYRESGYSDAELDQMLAPVALYPDVVLSQVLMAATYPEQLEDAANWSARHPHLRGSDATDAVAAYPWDPSVMALTAFPDLLRQMADDPGWTRGLGQAYLYQEGDVIDAIQRLRSHAYNSGHLKRLDHLRVYRDNRVVIIEPVNPGLIYLPYYRPSVVYGDWWWPGYDPYYWPSPRGYTSSLSFYWGSGFAITSGFFYSGFHWHDRHIVTFDRHHYRSYRGDRRYKHYHNARPWRRHAVHQNRGGRVFDGRRINREDHPYTRNRFEHRNDRDRQWHNRDFDREHRDFSRGQHRDHPAAHGRNHGGERTRQDQPHRGERSDRQRRHDDGSVRDRERRNDSARPGHRQEDIATDRHPARQRGEDRRQDAIQRGIRDQRDTVVRERRGGMPQQRPVRIDNPDRGRDREVNQSRGRSDDRHTSPNWRQSRQQAHQQRNPSRAERHQSRVYQARQHNENPRARYRDNGAGRQPGKRGNAGHGHNRDHRQHGQQR